MTDTTLPPALAEIADDFRALDKNDQLQLLLEFSASLPDLPERYESHLEELERVEECQAPVFLTVEVTGEGGDSRVEVFAQAPAQAPTTRGFAAILQEGVRGLTADQVLAIPADFPQMLGLADTVSPLRLRGMTGMLVRIKRQVSERVAAA